MAELFYAIAESDPGGGHDGHYTTWDSCVSAEASGWSSGDIAHLQMHNDWTAGYYDTGRYTFAIAESGVTVIFESYDTSDPVLQRAADIPYNNAILRPHTFTSDFEIRHLNFKPLSVASTTTYGIYAQSFSSELRIIGCDFDGDDLTQRAVHIYRPTVDVKIIGLNARQADYGIYLNIPQSSSGYANLQVVNTVIADNTTYGTTEIKDDADVLRTSYENCIFFGNATDRSLPSSPTENPDSAYNAFDTATTFGSNAYGSLVTSSDFVDSANGDYHLDSGSGLVDAGTDLSSTYGTDWVDIDDEAFDSTDSPIGSDQPDLTVSLIVQDCSHSVSSDNIVVTQVNTLTVSDTLHSHTADNIGLSAFDTLDLEDASHQHLAEEIDLVQNNTLSCDETEHTHSVENINLQQQNVLSAEDSLHSHSSENVDLQSDSTIIVSSCEHSHAVENLLLNQANVLIVNESTHSVITDNIDLLVEGAMQVQDALHGHSAGNVDLVQSHILVLEECTHSHTVENLDLDTSGALQVQDTLHDSTADNLDLTYAGVLIIDSTNHSLSSDNINLQQGSVLIVDSATSSHTVDAISLSEASILTIENCLHGHEVDSIQLNQASVLIVSDTLHSHLVDNIIFPGTVFAAGRLIIVKTQSRIVYITPSNRLINISKDDD